MAVLTSEVHYPRMTEERYNRPVFINGVERSRGILLAAKDKLLRKGLESVYHGSNTAPEASEILKIISLSEVKLRKVIRTKPEMEKEIQDGFETLLVGAEIQYSEKLSPLSFPRRSTSLTSRLKKLI